MANPAIDAPADNSQEQPSYESIAKELGMEISDPATLTTDADGTDSDHATDGEDDIPEAFRTSPKKEEKDASESSDPVEDEIKEALDGIEDETTKSQKEAGIRKVLDKLNTERQEIQAEREAASVLYSYADAFANKETSREAYAKLGEQLAKVHGWQQTQSETPQYDADSDSKYGLVHASDDIVLDKAVAMAIEQVEAKYGGTLKEVAPLAERAKSEARNAQVLAKAESHVTAIQAKFGDWMTKEMIAQAISGSPDMPIDKAIYATHGDAITAKAVEFASRGKGKPSLGSSAIASRGSEKEGTGNTYAEIMAAHGIDPEAVRGIF